VLGVYANSTDAFGEETRKVFRQLGTTVAQAIRITEQRQALVSDNQVELVFGVEDGTTTLFGLSRRLEGRLTIDRVLVQDAETQVAYGSVTGTTPEQFCDAADRTTGIERARVVSENGDGLAIELRVTGPTVATTVADHGGSFERLVAADGEGQMTVTLPAGARVTEFIGTFVDRHPESELDARRKRPGTDQQGESANGQLLTERQRDVVEAAFHSGFFEWPRDSSGEEVAETLDISPPTLQEHLRRAERKLVERHVDRNRPSGGKD
jgi:predicted DNA binding protein